MTKRTWALLGILATLVAVHALGLTAQGRVGIPAPEITSPVIVALTRSPGLPTLTRHPAPRPFMHKRDPFTAATPNYQYGFPAGALHHVFAQPIGTTLGRARRRATPSTQFAFGLGRSQESGGGQPGHQIGEIGQEIDALPLSISSVLTKSRQRGGQGRV